ncbi:MAG: hypothetical protein KDD44_08260 [Bdellovibrionales bacterium]|nr:hypothetical protein [Bdellovibrionales bacterium]
MAALRACQPMASVLRDLDARLGNLADLVAPRVGIVAYERMLTRAAVVGPALDDGIDLLDGHQGTPTPLVSSLPATLALALAAPLSLGDLRAVCRWWLRGVGRIAAQPLFE